MSIFLVIESEFRKQICGEDKQHPTSLDLDFNLRTFFLSD